MPSKPRSEMFDPDEVGVFHGWNRLVQRRHLFGLDRLSSRDYGYRKGWVRERLKQLAGAMAIEVLDDAILGNHLHVVLHNRSDLPCELGLLLQQVDHYRARLSDISWFMRLAY